LLVARAVESTEKGKPVSARQCLLAEIVEMMCTATIVHDSVLEDDEESMLGNVAHRTYSQNAGNKVSVLAGDFLLARCSVALSQLGDLTVVELMATALESIVQGGVLKAQARQAGVAPSLDDYEGRVRLKTASLIADACRSAAILAGEAHDSEVANAVYDYATALGLSYQVMFDTIRYHQILELAHVAESDVAISERILQEFISSPPVILSEIADVNAATTSRASLKKLSADVEAASGLNHAVALSKEHAERAKNALGLLPESREKQALLMMADFVSQEDQVGLQREKYVQSRADAAPV
jgi:geranylgeranyl pyrophosphate synthase